MLTISTQELFSEVESLPLDLKTKLIEKLLTSLNPSKKSIDHLWEQEIEARVQSIESGKVDLIDGEEVFQKIKDRFAK